MECQAAGVEDRTDPDDDALALAVGGVTVPWPRLFALDGDLAGALLPIRDGGRAKTPVPGGSLPLWWSREGIYARQRQGLVRCASPESGCVPVFRNPPGRRLVDARPFGRYLALALLVDTHTAELDPPPSEIWRVDLVSGSGVPLRGPGAGAFPLDLDWTSD